MVAIIIALVAVVLFVGLVALWFLYPGILARTAFSLIASPSPESRIEALDPLARLAYRGYPNAIEALDRATEDPDEAVRRAASRFVEEIGRSLGRLPLNPHFDQQELDRLKALLLGEDGKQRSLTAEQVKRLGDPWLYQASIQIRTDARNGGGEQRRRAVRALGLLGDPLSASYLLFALDDEDAGVRFGAAVAAGEIGAWRCRPTLENLARSDSDPGVRSAAQQAIKALLSPTAQG